MSNPKKAIIDNSASDFVTEGIDEYHTETVDTPDDVDEGTGDEQKYNGAYHMPD